MLAHKGYISTYGYGGGNPVWRGYGGSYADVGLEIYFAYFANVLSSKFKFDASLEMKITYLCSFYLYAKFTMLIDEGVSFDFSAEYATYEFELSNNLKFNLSLYNELELRYNGIIEDSFDTSIIEVDLQLDTIELTKFDISGSSTIFIMERYSPITSNSEHYKNRY